MKPSLFRNSLMLLCGIVLIVSCDQRHSSRGHHPPQPIYHRAQASIYVSLKTDLGMITIYLYPDLAPVTVRNFLHYVRDGHYNHVLIHKSIRNFILVAGGYDRQFHRLPTDAPIVNEFSNVVGNRRGTIAMNRTEDPNSATDIFMINLSDNYFLNFPHGYTVFGEVVKGMRVIDKIQKSTTGAKGPFEADVPLPLLLINEAVIDEDKR